MPVASPGIARSSLAACSRRSISSATACSSSRCVCEDVVAAQREDQSFGLFDQLLSPTASLADLRLDLIRRDQQRPHQRVVADDPPVFAGVAGGRHPAGELVDRLRTADLLELAVLAQRLGDGQVIDLARLLVQPQHRREHEPVLLAVEVLRAQLLIRHERVEVTFVEQHGAEHGLLGLEVVRRHGELLGRERCWSCGGLLLVIVDVGELCPQRGVLAFGVAHGLLTEDGPADLVHEPDEQRAVPGQLGERDARGRRGRDA